MSKKYDGTEFKTLEEVPEGICIAPTAAGKMCGKPSKNGAHACRTSGHKGKAELILAELNPATDPATEVKEAPKAAAKTETKESKHRICGVLTNRLTSDQREAAVELIKKVHKLPGIKAGDTFTFEVLARRGISEYHGLDGRKIKMSDKVVLRKDSGGARLILYPVHYETMEEFVAILERLPGCPTIDSKCPICGKPLFDNKNSRFANLAGVIRGLILKQFSIENLQFRQRHDACGKFDTEAEKLFGKYVSEVANLQFQYKPGEAKDYADGQAKRAALNEQVKAKKKNFFTALAKLAKEVGVGSEYVQEWYAQKREE